MDDTHGLVDCVAAWDGDLAELEGMFAAMSSMSSSSEAPALVSDIARAILFKASDVLKDYQSAMCNVYAARGCNSNEAQQAEDYIEKARAHLKPLQDISGLFAARGVPGEHPRVAELAAEIEDLRRVWKSLEPAEPGWSYHDQTPTLGEAQWLLNRMRRPGNNEKDAQAWKFVAYLGASPIYNAEPIWSAQRGPTAQGLLSDPTFKLFNLLNRSRLPGIEGLDSARLRSEVIMCEELLPRSPTDGVSTAPIFESGSTEDSLVTPSRTTSNNTPEISDNNATSVGSNGTGSSHSMHTAISEPTTSSSATSLKYTTPVKGNGFHSNGVPLREPTQETIDRVRVSAAAGLPLSSTYDSFWEKVPMFTPRIDKVVQSPMPTPIEIEEDTQVAEAPSWRPSSLKIQEKDDQRVDRRKPEADIQHMRRPASMFGGKRPLVRSEAGNLQDLLRNNNSDNSSGQ